MSDANPEPAPAPPKPTVSQTLLRYFKLEGVRYVFGIPGAAIMHLLNDFRHVEGIDYIVTRQETGAGYIADGYARLSGTLGVVAVTSGPGATNALTGAMCAQAGNSAVMVITGEIQEQYFGRSYLQEGVDASLDVNDVYKNAVQYSAMIDSPYCCTTLIEQALRASLGIPRRASHLSLPDDVAGSSDLVPVTVPPTPPPAFPSRPGNYRASPGGASPTAVSEIFAVLRGAKRPLIFLGNGCREALKDPSRRDAFEAFCRHWAFPVMTTPDGKGVFPESHPMSLRNFGIAACLWPAEYMTGQIAPEDPPQPYDALVVLGSAMGELATSVWAPKLFPAGGAIVQVDLDQCVIGRDYPVRLGVVAEVGAVIDDLVTRNVPDEDDPDVAARRAFVERVKSTTPWRDADKRDSTSRPILPQALMKTLGELLPPGSAVFVDAGNSVGWCLHHLTIDAPTEIFSSLSMGPMGWGVGTVIGGKLARPDRPCFAVVGDGAFMMHGAEVSTAAQYGIGAVWIVLSDNDLKMVSQGMDQFFHSKTDPQEWTDYYRIGDPDLALWAQAMGATAHKVESAGDLRYAMPRILDGAKDGIPQVVVVKIDPKEEPPYYPPKP